MSQTQELKNADATIRRLLDENFTCSQQNAALSAHIKELNEKAKVLTSDHDQLLRDRETQKGELCRLRSAVDRLRLVVCEQAAQALRL